MPYLSFVGALLTVVGLSDTRGWPLEMSPGQVRGEAQMQQHPFAGNWRANITRSTQNPDVQFQSATLRIAVAGEAVTLAARIVNVAGGVQELAETFQTDGRETSGTLNPGIVLIAKWIGPHVLATVAEREGQLAALVTYEISADGQTLWARTSAGVTQQLTVFERE